MRSGDPRKLPQEGGEPPLGFQAQAPEGRSAGERATASCALQNFWGTGEGSLLNVPEPLCSGSSAKITLCLIRRGSDLV